MKIKRCLSILLVAAFILGGCSMPVAEETITLPTETEIVVNESTGETEVISVEIDPIVNLEQYAGMTPEEIVATLTLEQKAAQMVQGAIYSLSTGEMELYGYGSVLSQAENRLGYNAWTRIVNGYQTAALCSSSSIPFLYGQDSVHGVNYASNTIIFPQNISIGATRDVEGAYEMGCLVANDLLYTGMLWNFAPCVACAQDPRWGRTCESYSSDPELVRELGVAFASGLIDNGVIACAKHFFGDGYTAYGTGEFSDNTPRLIDRGDSLMTPEQIEAELATYQALIDAGVQTIMISHSALNGLKMHENGEYIWYLKNEMGFEGFIVSDWNSIHNCSGEDLRTNVILAINAGIDMLMEPDDYEECCQYIIEAVDDGSILEERVDDAVTRIIRVKMNAGLFDNPYGEDMPTIDEYGGQQSYDLALRLAEESLVPLKDDAGLTIPDNSRILVMGPAADDTGVLCGGWTYTWTGGTDNGPYDRWEPNGVTILQGLRDQAQSHNWTIVTDESEIDAVDYIVLCVGEYPYAEWTGDTEDLSLSGMCGLGGEEQINMAANAEVPTIALIVAGRNVIISNYMNEWDSIIMCYLPGTTGGTAIANALAGDSEYTGTLLMPYYSSVDQIGTGNCMWDVGYSCVN